jgi:hypothetical protein
MPFLRSNLSGTWRGSPFVLGQRYRVIAPGPSYSGELAVGEVLKYFGAAYGHYDGVSVYVFVTDCDQERTWTLYDDEPLELWSSIFEPVD